MALTKAQKQKVLGDLKEKIDKQKSLVFASITGVKVKDLSNLRKKMKEKDCEIKVAKKTLVALSLKEKKIQADIKNLKGEIALGFGFSDELSPFKILSDFAKENKNLEILGGFLNGEIIGQEKAIEISQLPSREEILARLFFTVKSPLYLIANLLQKNLSILKVKS